MNTQKLILLATGFLITTQAFAQSPQPSDVEKQINAQAGVTSSMLQQMRDNLSKGLGTLTFKVSDYRAQAPAYLKNLEEAQIEFERSLDSEVFPSLRTYMNQYNSTYNSSSIGETQKTILLNRLESGRVALENELSAKYQRFIRKLLLKVAGPLLGEPQTWNADVKKTSKHGVDVVVTLPQNFGLPKVHFEISDTAISVDGTSIRMDCNSTINGMGNSNEEIISNILDRDHHYGWSCGYDGGGPQKLSDRVYAKFKERLMANAAQLPYYEQILFPFISQGCQSIACVTFRAADLKNFLSNVEDKVNRDLVYKLAGSGGYDRDYREINKSFTLHHIKNADVGFAVQELLRVDYPASASALPFDTAN